MKMNRASVFLCIACGVISACGAPSDTNENSASAESALSSADKSATVAQSPGKPGAPIMFRYEVQGTPIVGHPVAIDVQVTSAAFDVPIIVSYRVMDASSMSFPESQAQRTEFVTAPGDAPKMQQITVIPQKEGRLYLNVSAEIQGPDGPMIKSQAIPIQVGAAPRELETNGELKETEDGDAVVSMPSS